MIRLALLGDMGFFGRYCLSTNPKALAYFNPLAEILADHDLVVGNLEVPFANGLKPVGQKSAFLSADERNVELLQGLGVTAVCLANNHIYDFGKQGVIKTTDVLQAAGVGWFGIGPNSKWDWHGKGESIRFRGFCSYSTNPMGIRARPGSEQLEQFRPAEVGALLMRDRSEGWFPVLSMHSGEEHVDMPGPIDRRVAGFLADGCSYLLYGHSPHVVQAAEWIKESLILHSLGNFCFDDVYTPRSAEPLIRQSGANRTGLIASISIDKALIKSFTPFVFRTDPEGLSVFSSAESERFMEELSSLLQLEDDVYVKNRNERKKARLGVRKRERDLQWYLKRLNLNSAGIIFRAKRNRFLLKRTVVAPLEKGGSF